MLYQAKLPLVKTILYHKLAVKTAHKIHNAIQELAAPLDILEMEESYGTATVLIKMIKVPIVTRIHGPWISMPAIMG